MNAPKPHLYRGARPARLTGSLAVFGVQWEQILSCSETVAYSRLVVVRGWSDALADAAAAGVADQLYHQADQPPVQVQVLLAVAAVVARIANSTAEGQGRCTADLGCTCLVPSYLADRIHEQSHNRAE